MDMSGSYLIDIYCNIEEDYISSILETVLKLALLDSVLGFPAYGKETKIFYCIFIFITDIYCVFLILNHLHIT